jgi:hypothetical protein
VSTEPLPPVGSCWVDTDGPDGEVTVTGHDKGSYVLARNLVDEELYIQAGHFGGRYQRVDGGSWVMGGGDD